MINVNIERGAAFRPFDDGKANAASRALIDAID